MLNLVAPPDQADNPEMMPGRLSVSIPVNEGELSSYRLVIEKVASLPGDSDEANGIAFDESFEGTPMEGEYTIAFDVESAHEIAIAKSIVALSSKWAPDITVEYSPPSEI
jgi:hypothetical protein